MTSLVGSHVSVPPLVLAVEAVLRLFHHVLVGQELVRLHCWRLVGHESCRSCLRLLLDLLVFDLLVLVRLVEVHVYVMVGLQLVELLLQLLLVLVVPYLGLVT